MTDVAPNRLLQVAFRFAIAITVAFGCLSGVATATDCSAVTATLTKPPDANGDYAITVTWVEPASAIYVIDHTGNLIDLDRARANQQPILRRR
jgi:hypothetical protein